MFVGVCMKIAVFSFLILLGSLQPSFAHEYQETGQVSVAPADRYFGKMKMSILGVRNSINDLTATISLNPESFNSVIHKAEMVEDVLHDWATQYPTDPWLPKYTHSLVVLYQKCHETGDIHRLRTQDWLNEKFPDSTFADAF